MHLLELLSLLVMILQTVMMKNMSEGQREGKYMSLFSVVNFPNEACTTTSGYNGTCLASSECIGSGGEALGSCAQGFGTCCYFELRACGGTVTKNQTYLQNPSYPASYTITADTTCTYTFTKITTSVCQVWLAILIVCFHFSILSRSDWTLNSLRWDLLSVTMCGVWTLVR